MPSWGNMNTTVHVRTAKIHGSDVFYYVVPLPVPGGKLEKCYVAFRRQGTGELWMVGLMTDPQKAMALTTTDEVNLRERWNTNPKAEDE